MVFPISSLWGFCPYTFLRFLLSFPRSRVGRQPQVINLVGQCRWTTYCANLIRAHTFRSGSKLFGRAANFSVRPQTFRSGSILFCQAADYSVAHQTFRSRIKLFGRASNFPVGHQTFRSGFAVCIIYRRLPTFRRFLLSGFLSFSLPVPPSQFLSKSGEAPISSD